MDAASITTAARAAAQATDYTERDRDAYERGYADRLSRATRLPYGFTPYTSNAAYGQGWEDASATLPEGAN